MREAVWMHGPPRGGRMRGKMRKIGIILLAAAMGSLLAAGCGRREEGNMAAFRETVQMADDAAAEDLTAVVADAAVLPAGGIVGVTQNFSHRGFIDNIGFILPSGWTYDTYENINAGDDMNAGEWGIHVYVDGNSQSRISIYGSTYDLDIDWENPEDFVTGMGMTGVRYFRETAHGLENVRTDWIIFDPLEESYAYYRVMSVMEVHVYEENREVMREFLRGINIVCAARQEEE